MKKIFSLVLVLIGLVLVGCGKENKVMTAEELVASSKDKASKERFKESVKPDLPDNIIFKSEGQDVAHKFETGYSVNRKGQIYYNQNGVYAVIFRPNGDVITYDLIDEIAHYKVLNPYRLSKDNYQVDDRYGVILFSTEEGDTDLIVIPVIYRGTTYPIVCMVQQDGIMAHAVGYSNMESNFDHGDLDVIFAKDGTLTMYYTNGEKFQTRAYVVDGSIMLDGQVSDL